jgi:hypothetical protein
MKKRGHNDEQLPPLHPPDLYMVPHILGVSNTVGVSIIAGANDAASASNTAGTGRMLLALALQGANNIPGARALAGADNNPGANGSAGANQLFPTMYPVNPRDNLRMLEIMTNMDAFRTPPFPQTALYGTNTIVMWKKRYKQ